MHGVVVFRELSNCCNDRAESPDDMKSSRKAGVILALLIEWNWGKPTSFDIHTELNGSNCVFEFRNYIPMQDSDIRRHPRLPLRLFARDKGKCKDSLLDMSRVELIAGEEPWKTSGGEAQRTATTRTMVDEPPIYGADEWTGYLNKDNAEIVAKCHGLSNRIQGDYSHRRLLPGHSLTRILQNSAIRLRNRATLLLWRIGLFRTLGSILDMSRSNLVIMNALQGQRAGI